MTTEDVKEVMALGQEQALIVALGAIVGISNRLDYIERQLKGIRELQGLGSPLVADELVGVEEIK